MPVAHFLSLSNGLEALHAHPDAHLIRLRSTAVERALWDELVLALTPDLLARLAAGWTCIVHDRGTARKNSKTVSFAIPLLRAFLEQEWLDRPPPERLICAGPNGGQVDHGERIVRLCAVMRRSPPAVTHVRYWRRFLAPGLAQVDLRGESESTERDGDVDLHRALLASMIPPTASDVEIDEDWERLQSYLREAEEIGDIVPGGAQGGVVAMARRREAEGAKRRERRALDAKRPFRV